MLAAGCARSVEPAAVSGMAAPSSVTDSPALVPGSMIVQFDEELSAKMASAPAETKAMTFVPGLQALGAVKMERLFPDGGEWEPRHRQAGLHRWYRLRYDPEALPLTKAAAGISAIPGVVYSEPERKIRSTSYFNDPYAPRQWALDNDGTLANTREGCDINVVPVWDNYTAGSPDVIVAVLDLGVQLDHPDLEANCIPCGEDGSKSFIYGFEGYTIEGEDHGTHVAGIIAAVNDNGVGISGIAGGRDGHGVRIMSCPIMKSKPNNPDEVYQGDAYAALVWAADHGAVISQNSWGDVYETEEDARKGGVGAMGPAIDYFIRYAGCDIDGNQRPDSPMKGGVVFFAAGNDSWSIGWPAAYERVVAVGATDAKYGRTSYSNFGDWVDICAPGGDGSNSTNIFSTIAGSQYGPMMGTSMACPQVSGVAALIVSYFGGPGFTNDMLLERLLGGASLTKVRQNQMIGPMVDALGSFTYGGTEAPDPVSELTVSSFSNTVSLSWAVTADPDDIKTYGYLALACEDSDAFKDFNPQSIDSTVRSVSRKVGTMAVGDTVSATLSDLGFDTQYSVAVVAYDYQGHYSGLSQVRTIRTGRNNPPVVSTDYSGDYVIKPFEKFSVEFVVTDPDGHDFRVDVDSGSDAFTYSVKAGTVRCQIAGNAAPAGRYTAHIVAKDSYQDSTDYVIDYEILENHAPRVVAVMDPMSFDATGVSRSIELAGYIQDEDGERLSYTVDNIDAKVAHVNVTGNTMVVTPLGYGLTTVTITASDACRATCSFSFKILLRDGSRPVDLYPNPVVDKLNIRPGMDGRYEIAVISKAGATVWSDSVEAGPFDPLTVDLSARPGGTYYVRINGGSINDVFTIVKR